MSTVLDIFDELMDSATDEEKLLAWSNPSPWADLTEDEMVHEMYKMELQLLSKNGQRTKEPLLSKTRQGHPPPPPPPPPPTPATVIQPDPSQLLMEEIEEWMSTQPESVKINKPKPKTSRSSSKATVAKKTPRAVTSPPLPPPPPLIDLTEDEPLLLLADRCQVICEEPFKNKIEMRKKQQEEGCLLKRSSEAATAIKQPDKTEKLAAPTPSEKCAETKTKESAQSNVEKKTENVQPRATKRKGNKAKGDGKSEDDSNETKAEAKVVLQKIVDLVASVSPVEESVDNEEKPGTDKPLPEEDNPLQMPKDDQENEHNESAAKETLEAVISRLEERIKREEEALAAKNLESNYPPTTKKVKVRPKNYRHLNEDDARAAVDGLICDLEMMSKEKKKKEKVDENNNEEDEDTLTEGSSFAEVPPPPPPPTPKSKCGDTPPKRVRRQSIRLQDGPPAAPPPTPFGSPYNLRGKKGGKKWRESAKKKKNKDGDDNDDSSALRTKVFDCGETFAHVDAVVDVRGRRRGRSAGRARSVLHVHRWSQSYKRTFIYAFLHLGTR